MNTLTGKSKTTFVIFGGTGDLTFRKLLPALFDLYRLNKIGDDFKIIAIGRRSYKQEEYREIALKWIEKFSRSFEHEQFLKFENLIQYFDMDFTKCDQYAVLQDTLEKSNAQEFVYYYAVAPEYFDVITSGIMTFNFKQKQKILLEKPFGATLLEASKLSEKLQNAFGEENIYRIDHYLGKEMIRSIQTIRFENFVFENTWNKENIENIQIQALEEIGVETRGGYYDQSGALKDMVQNHLMQILTLVAMEEPIDKSDIQNKQVDVLKALRPIEKLDISDSLVLGQYIGYQQEEKVSNTSNTETFAACKIYVDNERWQNVPFYITTGKKMASREMNVVITFKRKSLEVKPNVLVIKIQPLEGVSFQFNMKKPGETEEIIQTEMDFCQSCIALNRMYTPEAYERLIDACLENDHSWFSSWEQISLSWKYIEKLKENYYLTQQVYLYKQGENGPKEVDCLVSNDHHLLESQLICKL